MNHALDPVPHMREADLFAPGTYVVESIKESASATTASLEGHGNIVLPRFSYIRAGNVIQVSHEDSRLLVCKQIDHPRDGASQFVKLLPSYRAVEAVDVGGNAASIIYRERMSEADWKQARRLEQFHYRGNGLNKIPGRRTVIIAEADGYGIIGYGVLSATVIANRARFKLLDTNVQKQMRSKLINQIARIPRVVVHPEYRGFGIGARLAYHLCEYARHHWDINGYAAIMVEVIASMTQYHRFFQRAGFVEAGYTEGNGKVFMPIYGQGSWDCRANAADYDFKRGMTPKPYLVYPLTATVAEKLSEKGYRPSEDRRIVEAETKLEASIVAERLVVNATTSVSKSERCDEVIGVFGLSDLVRSTPVLKDFTCRIEPGDAVLISGASGSGKSTLLKTLAFGSHALPNGLSVSGTLVPAALNSVEYLIVDRFDERPIIDQIGVDIEEAIRLLNSVGLAEAHLYLRAPSELSTGQRHRFALAQLSFGNKPVWVCDEFLTGLDPIAASVVAAGIRRLAKSAGATLLMASPNVGPFVRALRPNQLIHLNWGGPATIHSLKLRSDRVSSGYRLWVRNHGATDLSNVRVYCLRDDDNELEVGACGLLPSRRSTEKFSVSREDLKNVRTIVVSTNEGVGDSLILVDQLGYRFGRVPK